MSGETLLGYIRASERLLGLSCRETFPRTGSVDASHTLAEMFATLTGGRLGFQFHPADAAEIIRELTDRMNFVELTAAEAQTALDEAEKRGVREVDVCTIGCMRVLQKRRAWRNCSLKTLLILPGLRMGLWLLRRRQAKSTEQGMLSPALFLGSASRASNIAEHQFQHQRGGAT